MWGEGGEVMAVITISYQLGSGGYIVAQTVAEKLGYRIVGPGMLTEAAEEHELSFERLRRLSRAKLLDRLTVASRLYLAVIQCAVIEAATQDNVVLLGRGGQCLLRDVPHVLRVRIVAPLETRVRCLVEQAPVGGTPEAMAEMVRRDDADRAARIRFFYERDIDNPQLYDLVLNSHRGDLEGAAATIIALARRPTFATTGIGQRMITDRALAARVWVALMRHEETRRARHETVTAQDGRVHIMTAGTPTMVERVAGEVEGVVDVTTEGLGVVSETARRS